MTVHSEQCERLRTRPPRRVRRRVCRPSPSIESSEGVRARRQRRARARRVSLDVAPGEFVCLLGASGCGKSTLLNLVAGLDQPTSGTVDVAGQPHRADVPGSGAVPVAHRPWQRRPRAQARGRAARAERAQRADQLLEMVHLTDFAKKRPHELSGGMRQRVALARALAQDAEVLLMDEPFGALDAMTRDVLHDELESLWRTTGKTVMFVTHNVREAIRLGDRVVLLSSRPGRVAEITRSRSSGRGASTRPRSQPWRRRSPTACARRWGAMAAVK